MTRAEKLRAKIAPFADAIVITDVLNQYYISGFRFTDGYVLVTQKSAHIVTDFRYVEAAQKLAPAGFEIVTPARGAEMATYMRDVCAREGVKTVAFEEARITYAEHEKLKDALGVDFVPSRGVIEQMRRVKDKEEVDKMCAAQKITDDAFTHILSVITPEMTEIEVATELEYFMRKHGGEDKSFDTICVSGSASSLPHGVPRNRKLERGFLTMDYGCIVDGYHSDMTRTVCIGKADEEMKRLYNTVLKAQVSAIEGAKVGMKCAAVDAIARDIIEDAVTRSGTASVWRSTRRRTSRPAPQTSSRTGTSSRSSRASTSRVSTAAALRTWFGRTTTRSPRSPTPRKSSSSFSER